MAHVTDFKEAGFNTLLEELEWRGLISQSTDRDRLAEALNGEPITYYCGFDPQLHRCISATSCSSSTCVTCSLRAIIRSLWSVAPPDSSATRASPANVRLTRRTWWPAGPIA